MANWQRLKFLAFLFCAFPLATVVIGQMMVPLRHGTTGGPTHAITHAELRASQTMSNRVVGLIPLMLSTLGAIVLLIDAFRRKYDGPSAWPIAIAVMGFLSFGMMSTLYYAGWGWQPTKGEIPMASAFCSRCAAETDERVAGGVGTHNGVGSRLIGYAKPCDVCGSKIKTQWVTLIVPLLPLGSYRVLTVGTPTITRGYFLSRRWPTLYWPQVLPMVAVLVAISAIMVYFLQFG